MKKLRVAEISYWYPTENSYQGTFVRDITKCISAHADVVVYHLYVHRGKGIFSIKKSVTVHENSFTEHRFEIAGIAYKVFYLFPSLVWFFSKNHFNRTIVRDFNPQILHAHTVHPAGCYARLAARKHQIPYAITEHWSRVGSYLSKGFGRIGGISAYREARKISAVSAFLSNTIQSQLPELKIDVISNPVDNAFVPNPSKISGQKKLVCCAHWRWPKRPDLIFYGLNACAYKYNFELIVIGSGPVIDALGNSWSFPIQKFGNLNRSEIAEIFKDAHGFIHASEIETFGIVVAEALQCGLPVCASNVGALPDLITEKNGMLVINEIAEWEKALDIFLSIDWDYQKLAEFHSNFSFEEIGRKYTAWLTSALSSKENRV